MTGLNQMQLMRSTALKRTDQASGRSAPPAAKDVPQDMGFTPIHLGVGHVFGEIL